MPRLKKQPKTRADGFKLLEELRALRDEESRRLSKAEHAFARVDGAHDAEKKRLYRLNRRGSGAP